MSFFRSPTFSTLLLSGLMLLAVSGHAQTPPARGQMPTATPTPEQLRMLQQLPPSERQALLRSLGWQSALCEP